MLVRESFLLGLPAAPKARGLLNSSNVDGNGIVALVATLGSTSANLHGSPGRLCFQQFCEA